MNYFPIPKRTILSSLQAFANFVLYPQHDQPSKPPGSDSFVSADIPLFMGDFPWSPKSGWAILFQVFKNTLYFPYYNSHCTLL